MKKISCTDYTIYMDGWEEFSSQMDAYDKVIILVDENTKQHCLPYLEKKWTGQYELIEIPSGENHKNITTCQTIWNQLLELKADRHSLLVNLGGGVIGDMGGFCASTFMRGMDFIQIPTTLLSMVDASIGGKLGVDMDGFKNLIGLFKNPKAIFIDPQFLGTLPKREISSGMAEVIKHGLIADADYYEQVIKYPPALSWNELIARSIEIKKEVVEKDPLEKGFRKILNFGHTIGHAIESLNLDTDSHLLHGEAITLGMIAEAFISTRITGLSTESLEKIRKDILGDFSSRGNINLNPHKIFENCLKDKKNKNQKVLASLLSAIGKCEINVEISKKDVEEAMVYLKSTIKK